MWISNDKWEKMEKRLEELERLQTYRKYDVNFTLYPNSPIPAPEPDPKSVWVWNSMPYYGPSQDIAIKDVLEKVLKHLGITLKYDSGQPAKVQIEMPKKRT